jgi:ribosome-associated heat shock protein Hsp15
MERHRLDLWLKLVSVYKHRADATEACKGGHVRLNGVRAKPSASIREGDVIEITDGGLRKLVILGLPLRSVRKDVARTMYRDESPPQVRAPFVEIGRRDRGTGRPTKKERRDLSKYDGHDEDE